MSNLKKLCLKAFLFAVLVFLLCAPQVRAVGGVEDALNGADTAAKGAYGGDSLPAAMTDLPTAIGKIVGVVLSLVGVAFLILMIYGGFMWMFARGNEQDVTKAKDLIQAAIIGLVIVMAAYAITAYVGEKIL